MTTAEQGFFAPDSVAWRVLSAPATALMIAQVTNLLEVPHRDFQAVLANHDPLFPTNRKRQRASGSDPNTKSGHFHDRLKRTVTIPLPMIFGDKQTAIACARRLFNYHRPMHGVEADGETRYAATNPETMLFAAITITHAGLIAYEKFAFDGRRFPGRLSDTDRDQYFAEMTRIAVLMGVPLDKVPSTTADVDSYYRSISSEFVTIPGFTAAQRKTALALLRPDGWADVAATAADILLVLSGILGYAVLPKPSRRLHGLGAGTDPLFAAIRLSSLPLFALLRVRTVRRTALSWYVGADEAAELERASSMCRTPSHDTVLTACAQ
ncbi:oxygenase MpaB family protein [Mycobacterium sp. NPDC051804]|uniref:oxygenase MpaB family protein n=1 Tax=Mycobacterium sp. NPDC051804 TaxID=3364295 RepID=UPI0037BC2B19